MTFIEEHIKILYLTVVIATSGVFSPNLYGEECIPINTGNELTIGHKDKVSAVVVSPRGNKILTTSDDGTAKVTDIRTGKEVVIKSEGWITHGDLSRDGTKVVILGDKFKILNLKTGKEIKHESKYSDPAVTSLSFSKDGRQILRSSRSSYDGGVVVRNLGTGKTISLFLSKPVVESQFTDDGKEIVSILKDGNIIIRNLKSGQEKYLKHSGEVEYLFWKNKSNTSFSNDKKSILSFSRNQGVSVTNLKTGKGLRLAHGSTVSAASFSPNGSKIVSAGADKVLKIFNSAGKLESTIVLKEKIDDISFSPNGNEVVTTSESGLVKVIDLKTKMQKEIGHSGDAKAASFSPDGKGLIITSGERDNSVTFLSLETSCISDLPFRVACSDCTIPPKGDSELSILEEIAGKSNENEYCEKESPVKEMGEWSKEVLARYHEKDIPSDVSKSFLRRLQKPRMFNPEKHLESLYKILKSEKFVKDNFDLVAGALGNLYVSRKSLYNEILKSFPYLLDLKVRNKKVGTSCMTDKEREMNAKLIERDLDNRLGKEKSLDDIKDLKALLPLIKLVDAEKRSIWNGLVADRIAHKLEGDPIFRGVPFTTLKHYTSQKVAPIFFKVPANPSTELYLSHYSFNNLNITPIIFSRNSFEGSKKSDGGFYYKAYTTEVVIGKNLNKPFAYKDIEWEVGGKKYIAKPKMQFTNNPLHIPSSSTINYEKIWGDQTLKGMVVTHDNIPPENRISIMESYRKYYKRRNFNFSAPCEVVNFNSYLKNSIKSGSLDFLKKEAHSDFMRDALFTMTKKACVLRGEKIRKDGKIEIVELILPVKGSEKAPIILSELRTWFADRDKNEKNGEMIYINGSCHSVDVVKTESDAVNSKNFVNVSSKTNVKLAFHYMESSARMLESLSKGDDFKQMKESMERYQKEKKKSPRIDQYIFPGTKEHKEHFSSDAIYVVDQTVLEIKE